MEPKEIEYLYNLRRFGMKMDLSIMREFIAIMDNPHESLRFAHIAGTNGKGSVSSFLYSIMKRRYTVGLYTSPHLVRFNERIVVNDVEIDDAYIVSFVSKYRPIIDSLAHEMRNPTFFEVTTAMALKYFFDKNVDFAVLEVGLGGRLDATNIVSPDVSAITSIDIEHTKVLGSTLPKIAREKAGIIKRNVPVVVGEHKKIATNVIKKIAEHRNAPYHNVNDECHYSDFQMNLNGMRFTLFTPLREYNIHTNMLGTHQIRNIMTAVRMAELLSENYTIKKSDIECGISDALWRARFEIVRREPLIIFDAAHNPAGARVLSNTIRALGIRHSTLLFSMLADKDIGEYLKKFRGVVDEIIVTEIPYYRKMPMATLKSAAESLFSRVIAVQNPCEALHLAMKRSTVVATGSIYLLGELYKCLQ